MPTEAPAPCCYCWNFLPWSGRLMPLRMWYYTDLLCRNSTLFVCLFLGRHVGGVPECTFFPIRRRLNSARRGDFYATFRGRKTRSFGGPELKSPPLLDLPLLLARFLSAGPGCCSSVSLLGSVLAVVLAATSFCSRNSRTCTGRHIRVRVQLIGHARNNM